MNLAWVYGEREREREFYIVYIKKKMVTCRDHIRHISCSCSAVLFRLPWVVVYGMPWLRVKQPHDISLPCPLSALLQKTNPKQTSRITSKTKLTLSIYYLKEMIISSYLFTQNEKKKLCEIVYCVWRVTADDFVSAFDISLPTGRITRRTNKRGNLFGSISVLVDTTSMAAS